MFPSDSDILGILRKLVAFPTVSSESNLDLIAWVENYLDSHAVPHWRVQESANKSSVLARIGPDTSDGIVLSGHTDVVPVKDQAWQTDPFTLTEIAGRCYGRGTADMKAFLALALAYVPYFQSLALKAPIWLAFSHDEEIGCLGAAPMAQALIERKAAPRLVVIGEPTRMKLVGSHKGILSFETIVTGREAHSSMPEQGVNAVMIMAELMHVLGQVAKRARAVTDADYTAVTPYASVHIGVVEGGTARNIIPRHCRMAWEVRPVPSTDIEVLLAPFHQRSAELEVSMKQRDPACGIITRALTNVRGLHAIDAHAPHITLAHRLASSNALEAVAFGTEGGIFQARGLPVVICGPGSIDEAHQPNEFIEHAQLQQGAAFMQRVGEACAQT